MAAVVAAAAWAVVALDSDTSEESGDAALGNPNELIDLRPAPSAEQAPVRVVAAARGIRTTRFQFARRPKVQLAVGYGEWVQTADSKAVMRLGAGERLELLPECRVRIVRALPPDPEIVFDLGSGVYDGELLRFSLARKTRLAFPGVTFDAGDVSGGGVVRQGSREFRVECVSGRLVGRVGPDRVGVPAGSSAVVRYGPPDGGIAEVIAGADNESAASVVVGGVGSGTELQVARGARLVVERDADGSVRARCPAGSPGSVTAVEPSPDGKPRELFRLAPGAARVLSE